VLAPWQRQSFLMSLTVASRAALWERGIIRKYPRDAGLILEGDDSDRVMVLLEGAARVSSVSEAGVEVLLAIVNAGDLVGAVAALSNGPRSASVTCIDDTEVLVIPSAEFRDLVRSDGDLALAVLDACASLFRELNRRYVENATRDVLSRVAIRLVDLAQLVNEVGHESPVALSLTQQEVGAWVGASRESAGKALQRLVALGLIETSRSTVTIIDMPGLRAQARGQ